MQNKHLWGFLLILCLHITFLSVANCEEPLNYYSPENVLKFADFLYEQEDYLRAIGEYQRYLFYKPVDSEKIHYKIALCYRLGGKAKQAIQQFERLLNDSQDNTLRSNAYYQIGVSYFLMDQFEGSAKYLQTYLPHITEARLRAESQQLIGFSFLMQKQWFEAEKVFNTLQKSDMLEVRKKALSYSMYAEQGTKLPTRSPFLAGLFSAIVPGTGRLYTGRIVDAINSAFIVGLTGWQAYDGFRRDGISSAKGWTLGTLSGIFYVGNIYGSVISARVYNNHIAEEYLATLSIVFPY